MEPSQTPIYFPMVRSRAFGAAYIEEGILYPRMRVCQIEEESEAATCDAQPRPGSIPGRKMAIADDGC